MSRLPNARPKLTSPTLLEICATVRTATQKSSSKLMDNLNTHSIASLYEAFPPAEARPLAEKREIHHTPKYGSWLDVAEIELSVLARQCLHQRIGSLAPLIEILKDWEKQRNAEPHAVSWRFTTEDARIKLRRLYPALA